MDKVLNNNNIVVKEVLNDISNYFELSLNKIKGLHNLQVEECLFLTQEELMCNAIITINDALERKIGAFEAFVTVLGSANSDIREDDLWLSLLTEKDFMVKIEGRFVRRNLLEYLLDLATLDIDTKFNINMIKFIKIANSMENDIKNQVLKMFTNSKFFKNHVLKLDTDVRELMNKSGIKEKLLLQDKPQLKRKYVKKMEIANGDK